MGRLHMVLCKQSWQRHGFRAKIHPQYSVGYWNLHAANHNNKRILNRQNNRLKCLLFFYSKSASNSEHMRSKISSMISLHFLQCSKNSFSGIGPSTSQLIRLSLWKVRQQGGYPSQFLTFSLTTANVVIVASNRFLRLVKIFPITTLCKIEYSHRSDNFNVSVLGTFPMYATTLLSRYLDSLFFENMFNTC